MARYKYSIEKPKELLTKISNPETFVIDAMNEIGARGGQIISAPVEFQEPSTDTDERGRPMAYYGVILFVRWTAEK